MEDIRECQSCRWFDPEGMPKDHGVCRKNPPTNGDGFPPVTGDDWCSKFKFVVVKKEIKRK